MSPRAKKNISDTSEEAYTAHPKKRSIRNISITRVRDDVNPPSEQLSQAQVTSKHKKKWPVDESELNVEPAFMSNDDFVSSKKSRDDSHFRPLETHEAKIHHKKHPIRKIGLVLVFLAIIFILCQFVFNRMTVVMPGKQVVEASFANEILPIPVKTEAIVKNTTKNIALASLPTTNVEKKASGTIVLYNEFSTKPYDLVKTTRLTTKNGSIYRLDSDVKIPGMTTTSGKVTPGTITAKVTAEKAGSEYNAPGGLELRLPGLIAGTVTYNKVYAKTSANFTGGAKGTALDTSSSELQNGISATKESLRKELLENSGVDMVILEDSIEITHTIQNNVANTQSQSKEIPVNFTTKAIGLDKKTLSESLVKQLESRGLTTTISEDVLPMLQYKVSNTDDDVMATKHMNISVNGSVSAPLTPEFIKALESELANQGTEAIVTILKSRFSRDPQEIKIWPLWANKAPSNPDKIKLLFEKE